MIKVTYYTAEWCLPCKKFLPVASQVCFDHDVQFVKLDVDVDPVAHSIQSVPTVVIEKDGEMVDSFGVVTSTVLRGKLAALRG